MVTTGITVAGKVVLVTGGSRGLGFAMADALARFGADLAIVNRNVDEGEAAATKLRAHGRRVVTLQGDVTRPAEVARFVAAALAAYGRIDVLLNSAGMNIRKPALEVTEDDWDRVIDCNLKGIFFTAQAVGRVMIERRAGKIINMSSIFGSVGFPKVAVYAASKGGINQLTRVLALEWAPYNVCVNALAPAYIVTEGTPDWMQDPERTRMVMASTPLGRVGSGDDLTGAVVYLASDWSNYVTGTVVGVDGGWLAR
jgi:NAD(P)-dependent dehydrogenase (short-subunit alcohol dehydrogenase family)